MQGIASASEENNQENNEYLTSELLEKNTTENLKIADTDYRTEDLENNISKFMPQKLIQRLAPRNYPIQQLTELN